VGMPGYPNRTRNDAVIGSEEEPWRSPRHSVGTLDGTHRGQRHEGGRSPPVLTEASQTAANQASWGRERAEHLAPSSGNPRRALGRAGDGPNREGLIDDEPSASGRGIDREKAGKEGRPIEFDGQSRGIAWGQRSYG
jgi:hypothetical protein